MLKIKKKVKFYFILNQTDIKEVLIDNQNH